jgi:hypothetical protein
VTAAIDIDHGAQMETMISSNSATKYRVVWDSLTKEEIATYNTRTEQTLGAIDFNHDLAWCTDLNCKNAYHLCVIDRLYADIVSALQEASTDLSKSSKATPRQLPGWNDYCHELHAEAREAFLTWRANSSPRFGPHYEVMRRTRAQFKYALRQCKSNHDKAIADSLANRLLHKDSKTFWKEVKSLNNSNGDIVSNVVAGAVGQEGVCDMWQQHFKSILNSSSDTTVKQSVLKEINQIHGHFDFFTLSEITESVKTLKTGKSPGMDCLCSEHLKFASYRLTVLLTLFFNAVISHGYIPEQFMDSVIIPILKDKKGDITDKDNYRPIALTSVLSKVLEILLLH